MENSIPSWGRQHSVVEEQKSKGETHSGGIRTGPPWLKYLLVVGFVQPHVVQTVGL